MKKFFTFLCCIIFSAVAFVSKGAEDESETSKPIYKFGGIMDLRVMYDSYNYGSARNGVVYFLPEAPNYDNNGVDLNRQDQLYFSPFATRINFSVSNFKALGADARIYIEGDFMGSADSYLQMLRMRHGYLDLNWGNSSFLIGQTYNLNFNYDVCSNSIDLGGLPFNPLNRGMVIRGTHKLSPLVELRGELEMFEQHKGVGPSDSQVNAALPYLGLQLAIGDKNGVFGGITLSGKSLQPRIVDDSGYATNKRVSSFSVNGFFKFDINKYWFKFWSIYGSNLTFLTMNGGYGKVAADSASGDYNYGNLNTLSSWFDFETPIYKKSSLQFGLFVGHQQNMGSNVALDMTKDSSGNYQYGYYRYGDVAWYGRVSPRVLYYATPKMSFGLEYSYNIAQWAKEMDEFFNPISYYKSSVDNRLLMSVRYFF